MNNIFANDPVPFDGPKYVSPEAYREANQLAEIRQMQIAGGKAKMSGDMASNALAQERKQRLIDAKGDPVTFRAMSANAGDWEQYAEVDKHILGSEKGQADIEGKGLDNSGKLDKVESAAAIHIINNPSIETVKLVAQKLRDGGYERGAKHLFEMAEQYPDASAEDITSYLTSLVDPKAMEPKYVNGTQTNQLAPKGTLQTLPMSPYQAEQVAGAKDSRNIARGHLGVAQETLAFNKTKERATSTAQQKLEEKDRLTEQGAANSLDLIDRMTKLVKDSPRSTATPLAGPARAYEAARSVFDPSNKNSPAIEFTQTRDALIATAEGLKKDSRMSNQDRQRLENAIGANSMTTPENTIKSLQTIKEIIIKMSKAGASGASGSWKDL